MKRKYINSEKIAGEMAIRRMSKKAQDAYYSTDPMALYEYTPHEDTLYTFTGEFAAEGLTFQEAEEYLESLYDALIEAEEEEEDDDPSFRSVGYWMNTMNSPAIEMIEIDGTTYALHGWNGETYEDCWECIDAYTAGADGIRIRPIYGQVAEDEFELAGYEVL